MRRQCAAPVKDTMKDDHRARKRAVTLQLGPMQETVSIRVEAGFVEAYRLHSAQDIPVLRSILLPWPLSGLWDSFGEPFKLMPQEIGRRSLEK